MDLASVIGLILAVGLILGSILLGSAPVTAFVDVPSILVVLGGAFAAAMICFPLKNILGVPKVVMKVLMNKGEDVPGQIALIVKLAETARREGLLALEGRIPEIEHPLIRTGVQMAVDGSTPEAVEEVLRTEVEAVASRHRDGKSVMDQLGRFAPAYGMIGTLMGLIMMLSDMSDPTAIGAGMAVALITTLYGAIVANVFFSPFATKLGLLSKKELISMEIAIRGIRAIQNGESPRAIEQKLSTFLPPEARSDNGQ